MTRKQHTLLAFIADTISKTGTAPTIAEMRAHMNARSAGSIMQLIGYLMRDGWIDKPWQAPRGIVILKLPADLKPAYEPESDIVEILKSWGIEGTPPDGIIETLNKELRRIVGRERSDSCHLMQ